jgi:hypothetical protein
MAILSGAVPGLPHHVTQRGDRRQPLFAEPGDYALCRGLLAEPRRANGVACRALSPADEGSAFALRAQPRSSDSRARRRRRLVAVCVFQDRSAKVRENRSSTTINSKMSSGASKRSIHPIRWRLRLATMALVVAELLFWAYTFYYIGRHPKLNGTGLEIIAMIPMTAIALFLTLPALLLTFVRRALWFAFGLALLAGAADLATWGQVVAEIGRATSGD